MQSPFEQSKLLWRPRQPLSSRMEVLRKMINDRHGIQLKDYHDLHRYSVEDYQFWKDLSDYLPIVYSTQPSKVIELDTVGIRPTWFPGARLNYAQNMLPRNDEGIALTAGREDGNVIQCSWRDLRQRVRQMAAAMHCVGIRKGDRVAGVLSNRVDAVVILLATASLGAVFSCTAPDMGAEGIIDRYRQITPKILFAETEVQYGGKALDVVPKIMDVAQELLKCGLEHTVLLSSPHTGNILREFQVPQSLSMPAFLAKDNGRDLMFEQLPFDHPLYIMYSSGTSGSPKCIVHTAGGVLIQTKKDTAVHLNLSSDDAYFHFTTTGWMMWPYMLSILSTGGRAVLYDGSPFHPDMRTFLKFVNDQRVTFFGASPRFFRQIQAEGIEPLKLAPFDALRRVASTGAVFSAPMFEWAQQAFGPNTQIISMSGGTDICAAFVGGVPTLPVYAGELQGKTLGVKVEVFDPEGRNVEHTGQPGELVCTRPHPSVPLCFWGDESGEKLEKTYYDMYPGVWRQGDFVVVNPRTKGLIMLGRSDGVLNPSGVRFGSAEIYGVMERFSDVIEDTLCVGQRRPRDHDERVLLFLKMRERPQDGSGKGRYTLTPKLEYDIRNAIRTALSARHVPQHLFAVEDIPYTTNGKKIETAVKQIVSGHKYTPSGAVVNPESLKEYHQYFDLEGVLRARGARKKSIMDANVVVPVETGLQAIAMARL